MLLLFYYPAILQKLRSYIKNFSVINILRFQIWMKARFAFQAFQECTPPSQIMFQLVVRVLFQSAEEIERKSNLRV